VANSSCLSDQDQILAHFKDHFTSIIICSYHTLIAHWTNFVQ
jgi:hypothetical protein